MRDGHRISVIIPALNEAASIANVLRDIPDWVDEIVVVDNGSDDGTVSIAEQNGARVVHEPHRGYGSACLRGIAALTSRDIVVFLDGDYSDHPDQMDRLVSPILADEADLVIGSRSLGNAEPGSLSPQSRFGNKLACSLMRLFWKSRFTDLGPFRAIRHRTLQQFNMSDPDYGWTVEMQIKAALHRIRTTEVPVDYRKRIGRSKVSGTIRGAIGAGYKILGTIFLSATRYHLLDKFRKRPRRRLILFTRYPVPGQTKTRLIPTLGPEGAAELQRSMTERALNTANTLLDIELEVWYTNATKDDMQDWLGPLAYVEQPEVDLGGRMHTALHAAFEDGVDQAIIIGIDCPAITAPILTNAFNALNESPVVIGPATDGGYYLIGTTSSSFDNYSGAIFNDMNWGTDEVFPETQVRLAERGISFTRLCYLNDIDEARDLDEWEILQPQTQKPALSIIVPTLNEADTITDTLELIAHRDQVEIIVVDGGSSDDTTTIARNCGARVLTAERGRALQMNIGAAQAHAETILFLHADTRLPETFQQDVANILADPTTVCGAFKFATHDPTPAMKLIAVLTNARARWLNLPYGDQGLFMPLQIFREIGGFRDLPIMEDFDLVRKLAKRGRVRIATSRAITNARRWQQRGILKTLIINQRVIVGWYLGVDPAKLALWYRNRVRQPDQ